MRREARARHTAPDSTKRMHSTDGRIPSIARRSRASFALALAALVSCPGGPFHPWGLVGTFTVVLLSPSYGFSGAMTPCWYLMNQFYFNLW